MHDARFIIDATAVVQSRAQLQTIIVVNCRTAVLTFLWNQLVPQNIARTREGGGHGTTDRICSRLYIAITISNRKCASAFLSISAISVDNARIPFNHYTCYTSGMPWWRRIQGKNRQIFLNRITIPFGVSEWSKREFRRWYGIDPRVVGEMFSRGRRISGASQPLVGRLIW